MKNKKIDKNISIDSIRGKGMANKIKLVSEKSGAPIDELTHDNFCRCVIFPTDDIVNYNRLKAVASIYAWKADYHAKASII